MAGVLDFLAEKVAWLRKNLSINFDFALDLDLTNEDLMGDLEYGQDNVRTSPRAEEERLEKERREKEERERVERENKRIEEERVERERLKLEAERVLAEPVMATIPKGANEEDKTTAGLEVARGKVRTALGEPDTRKQGDIEIARGLLLGVQEAIARAEENARVRMELEAQKILNEAAMTTDPRDATEPDKTSAGLEVARNAVRVALGERDTRQESDLEKARLLLPGVQEAIVRTEENVRKRLEMDRLEVEAQNVLNEPAMKTAPKDAEPSEILAAGVEVARQAVRDALKTKETRVQGDIDAARQKLPDVQLAIEAAEEAAKQRLDEAAYRLEYTKIETAVNDAALVAKDILADSIPKDFESAKLALNAEVLKKDWVEALRLVTPLKDAAAAVNLAKTQHEEYENEFATFEDEFEWSQLAVYNAGLPKAEEKQFHDAWGPVRKERDAKNWLVAKGNLAALKVASLAIDAIVTDGSDYYDEVSDIEALCDQADEAVRLRAVPLQTLLTRYTDAQKVAKDFAAKKQWVDAENAVPALKQAAQDLVDAADKFKEKREKFLEKFNNLTKLPEAQKIAANPPKKLVAVEVKNFRDRYIPFNDAKNKGDFTTAEGALVAVQGVIDILVSGKATYDTEKDAYEKAKALLTDHDAAFALAWGGLTEPLIVPKVDPFKLADKAVNDAVALEDWNTAKGALDALKDAAEKILAAKALSNNGVNTEGERLFKEKIAALNLRTGAASEPTESKFIDTLQKAVSGRVTAIDQLVTAKDFASAELGYKQLLLELDKMEDEKGQYKLHFTKYDSAKKGGVASSLATDLQPTELANERNKGLAVTEKRIKDLADKGKWAKADKDVAAWLEEANAWKAAKKVYDNLNSGVAPDKTELKKLADLPGGGKVFDALMAGLPETRPQKFVKEALTARYGIKVKQFEKTNPDDKYDISTGVTKVNPNLPDKSLVQMYKMLGAVPVGNVKGNITKLIQFNEDQSGAAYGSGEVWMYCGRADDPNASTQKFSQPGQIVPEGEEVDLDCQPEDASPVSYFNFAALHEVGHAVDEAKGIMDGAMNAEPDWQSHKSAYVAQKAATHFGYDLDFVKGMLANANNTPPPDVIPGTHDPVVWQKARDNVVDWCRAVRLDQSLWGNAGLSKQLALGDRVFQESYKNKWTSYKYAARAKGISGYQFRSAVEWFAELYAAYFSGKLKKSHPSAAALKALKKP